MRHEIITAAVLIAAAGLTSACGTAAARPRTPRAPQLRRRPRPAKQQYSAWKHGPALAPGKRLVAALNAVQSAGTSEDIPAMTAALKTAGSAAVDLGRYPIPACADPHGYWGAVLARIRAAGDNAGTASGLSGLILAEAPLKDVPGLEAKLDAELKRTT
jgi:hypothetical protein